MSTSPLQLIERPNLTVAKVFSFCIAVAAAVYIMARSATSSNRLLPLMALTAALIGWIVGILSTPLDTEEGLKFGELTKVISGFVTGYLLSKVDPLIGALVAVPNHGRAVILDPQVAEELLVTLSSFFLAVLFVVCGRLYWTTEADKAVCVDVPSNAGGNSNGATTAQSG